jgi:deoxyribodipyrimidine photo-lyase
MQKEQKITLFWFRRDLRLHDNHGLYRALNSGLPVLPVFIFDAAILGKLTDKNDPRITFIHEQIHKIKTAIEKTGGSILIIYDNPLDAFRKLLNTFDVQAVYANKDYEPYTRKRDREVGELLKEKGADFLLFKDQVIFEENEVVKENGQPYIVFTPYSKKWKEGLDKNHLTSFPSEKMLDRLLKTIPFPMPKLSDLGFKKSKIEFPPSDIMESAIRNYAGTRNFPAQQGTTRLGIHLRFGTISIRELTGKAAEWSEVYLNELIWRNFFSTILWHFPHVADKAFKQKYNFIRWRNNEEEFKKWCLGNTGYPMVDAGMRELNETGFMHNRVRMITAGFLTKHLLIDWRWGEAYFAEKLLDFELASNNGNWQWAAGTGCDAAPYFRIFNPKAQQEKFDPQNVYVNKWIPELGTGKYPQPIVVHETARQRALKVYKDAVK